MRMLAEYSLIGPIIGAIGTLCGAFVAILKVKKTLQEESDARVSDAISDAKKEIQAELSEFKKETELHLESIRAQIESVEKSSNKDLSHLRETYNNEIKNLAGKIEDLRSQLADQHGSLVTLLTSLIGEK